MRLSRLARCAVVAMTLLGFAFLYLPLVVVVSTSLSKSGNFALWPRQFSLDSWQRAVDNPGARHALGISLMLGVCATGIALVLGTLLAFAIARFEFFGRQAVSLAVVLPIALPGIVTALSLNLAFNSAGFEFGFGTLVLAHSTFCIVVAYNNVVARLRRLSPNLEEASSDLGAHSWQTFRFVTFPLIRSALVAGALLSFALSFDEIVVTTFTAGHIETLPQWILNNTFRGRNVGMVAAVASIVALVSILPVWASQRMGDATTPGR